MYVTSMKWVSGLSHFDKKYQIIHETQALLAWLLSILWVLSWLDSALWVTSGHAVSFGSSVILTNGKIMIYWKT